MKAMILDDDPLITSLLVAVFQRRGYEVITYGDPTDCPLFSTDDCLCPKGKKCFDVIISDYEMPFVNGLRFFEVLHKKGCRCSNIALMSGSSMPREVVIRASDLNVKFFAKPFHSNQIIAWLDQIEHHRQSAPPRAE